MYTTVSQQEHVAKPLTQKQNEAELICSQQSGSEQFHTFLQQYTFIRLTDEAAKMPGTVMKFDGVCLIVIVQIY